MMFEKEKSLLEVQISDYCRQNNIPVKSIRWVWIPFSGHWGISTSMFEVAAEEVRQEKKGNVKEWANKLAIELVEYINLPPGIQDVKAVHGYLNFYFSSEVFVQKVLDSAIGDGVDFGRGPRLNQLIMVEYSHPNTHKAFHVGHLRSAILGDVLSRILDFSGYEVVRANYPGDIGLHVMTWLWNYQKYHSGEEPAKDTTRWMGDLYAEAVKRLEENPEFEAEIRALYTKWDRREPEIVNLWEKTRQWSLDGFNHIYDLLGIRFDRYYFNSMVENEGKAFVQKLIERNIASDERPDAAVVVKIDELLGLKNETFRVMVVLRSDGTALYATEDLALVLRKFNDYPDLVKSLYVVDVRQSLHFTQVFKTLEIAGYEIAKKCQHVPYELVNLPGNVTMASRDGTVVLLEDLIREATARARYIVEEKNPDLPSEEKNRIAQAVAVGAIKYPILSRDNTKIVTFDWDSAMDINGQAAPYIQYAYVRANSIMQKVGKSLPVSMKPDYQLTEAEFDLINLIARFPEDVQRAAKDLRPLEIANLSYNLAKAFNNFYTQCPVLKADERKRNVRLRLVAAAKQAIGNSLALLGITAPEAM